MIAGGQIETVTPDELDKALTEYGKASHIGYGADSVERVVRNWPVQHHERKIRVRNSHGTNNFAAIAATYLDLFPPNHGRGGLSVINIGANPCYVFLTTAAEAKDAQGAVASGYLFANNGTWDGKFGNGEWVGPVSVYSALGTTLVIGEI